MKAWRGLVAATVFALGVGAAFAQTPVLGSIEAPYAPLQSSVKIAGATYGPGAVTYGPVLTPLVLSGSGLGASGTVQFIAYKNGAVDASVTPVQATTTMWTSNMIILTVPSGAYSGLVKVTTEGGTSNGLPFLVMPGSYSGSCPAGPSTTQLQITTSSLHNGAVGQAYSATLGASGGKAPYTWSITSGTLPSGLTLNASAGTISGTPTAVSSAAGLTFQVTDSSSPTQTDTAVLSLTIETQTLGGAQVYNFTATSYDGVGNLTGYTDTVMGTWGLSYDTLNRLATATLTWPNTTQQYACWNYDSFGNRQQQEISSASFTSPSGGASPCQPQSSASLATDLASYSGNNQITSTNARGVSAVPGYDLAGNMTSDGVNTYLYDAESRICAVASTPVPSMTTMTGYLYDADGTRVAKGSITSMSCDPTANGFQFTENYVLGPGGEELTMLDGSNNWQRTNVYAAGKLLATYDINGLHFHLTDPLGTRRMQLSGNLATLGQPETDFQNLPFGDQFNSFPDQYAPPSADDSTPLHFTGKERDTESGNDYFGARYFASSMGRMLSPDPGNISAIFHMDDPQSWNGYAYAHNNPLRFTDPTGDTYQVCDSNGQNCSNLDDKTFETDQAKDQANGEYFQNGSMFHIDGDGNHVTDGTYNQTDVDQPGDAGTNIAAMGQIARDGNGAINMMVTNIATTVATAGIGEAIGPAISGYIQAGKLSMLKPLVTNPKLAEIVEELFQATDKVPGGTAGAVRFESESGIMLSPAGHAQDAQSIVGQLNNLLKNPNTGWSSNDQAVAKELIRDLQNSLSGK